MFPLSSRSWICSCSRPWNTANCKCCVCGKESVTKLPKSFQWPWKDEECSGQIAYQLKCETYASIAETHPIPSTKDLEACVESLLQQDIIEPANGPTLWVSPMVSVPKPRQAQFSFFGFAILDT